MFYVDHNNRKTQWEHPQVSKAQMKEQDFNVSILSFSGHVGCLCLFFESLDIYHYL